MSRRRRNRVIRCPHFRWTVSLRNGVYYADGRSNRHNAGRHSLNTDDENEALANLQQLDRIRAQQLGLASGPVAHESKVCPLTLSDGRSLYERHISRPRVAGGVRESTAKRYRSVFDKFIPWAQRQGVETWNAVTGDVLTSYAAHLEREDFAQKTLVNELTTLKQTVNWLSNKGHLVGAKPIDLKLTKAESQRAYCYRPEELRAMVELCQASEDLHWIGNIILALIYTGLRISELASLVWPDIDFEHQRVTLTDESGRTLKESGRRRELKSGRSRSFPIHPNLLPVLQRLPRTSKYVFRGPRGGKLKPDTVRRIFVRDVITPLSDQFPSRDGERGFPDGRLHSFRHAFCSTCAMSGAPERVVMDWLGHSDSAMIKHYFHLHDSESRRRMNQLDFLGGAGGRTADDDA